MLLIKAKEIRMSLNAKNRVDCLVRILKVTTPNKPDKNGRPFCAFRGLLETTSPKDEPAYRNFKISNLPEDMAICEGAVLDMNGGEERTDEYEKNGEKKSFDYIRYEYVGDNITVVRQGKPRTNRVTLEEPTVGNLPF